jgi:septal ring factor EnvC (AmiA/AmiB activator)
VKVSEFERHIENLKKDNDVLRDRLHDLKIDSNSQENNNKDTNDNEDKYQDEEIMEMNKKLGVLNKDY